jgi:hypothetical protein
MGGSVGALPRGRSGFLESLCDGQVDAVMTPWFRPTGTPLPWRRGNDQTQIETIAKRLTQFG